eukprot:m.39754 g.39754  ORF g.39754 m.39754 type:complete len:696 (+) comp6884_c1_seq1:207-2294(+)
MTTSSLDSIPWEDLLGSETLQKVLKAIIQRLDRHENVISKGAMHPSSSSTSSEQATSSKDEKLSVIPTQDLNKLIHRLETLENMTIQGKLEEVKKTQPLKAVAAKGQSGFRLADHVIPLTQLKARVEGCDVGIAANSAEIDAVNERMTELAEALQEELAKMVTKEEFHELERKHDDLEDRHNKLDEKVERMFKDLVERLEKMIKELQKSLDRLTTRVDANEERINRVFAKIKKIEEIVEEVNEKVNEVKAMMDLKADKMYVDELIEEIRAELAKINLDEIRQLIEHTNARVDLMDERCDKLEDDQQAFRQEFLRWQKDMEDLQLEKQIEQLRRELDEAKTGVFVKATARMDSMQKETEELRESLTTTQGQVQLNRENVDELQDAITQINPNAIDTTSNGGTKALITQLQHDVANLEQRIAETAQQGESDKNRSEELQQGMSEIRIMLEDLHKGKADRHAVEIALNIKADKDAVARDTERNLKAVDEALSVMNAGTQGVQQMLEKQEMNVMELAQQLGNKMDREELEKLQEKMETNQISPEEAHEQQEAIFNKYGLSMDDAAGMRRPMEPYNCISCNRPIRPQTTQSRSALPLLPQSKGKRPQSSFARTVMQDGVVEVSEIPKSLRSAGGTHTSPRYLQQKSKSRQTIEIRRDPRRSVELVGEDGRIYQGRVAVPKSNNTSLSTRKPSVQKSNGLE